MPAGYATFIKDVDKLVPIVGAPGKTGAIVVKFDHLPTQAEIDLLPANVIVVRTDVPMYQLNASQVSLVNELYPQALTVNEALTELGKLKSSVCNPNLLDNPWFTINQRGQTSYTTTGYGFDRWTNVTGGYNVTQQDGFIRVAATVTGSYLSIRQLLEQYSYLAGKTVTISFLYRTNIINWYFEYLNPGSTYIAAIPASSEWTILSRNVTLPDSLSNFGLQIVSGPGAPVGGYIDLKAVKLELGSVSTLANEAPPNYASELAKCQRYYQEYNSKGTKGLLGGTAISTTILRVDTVIPTMRANPSVLFFGTNVSNSVRNVTNNQQVPYTPSSFDVTSKTIKYFTGSTGTLTIDTSYDFNITLSADL